MVENGEDQKALLKAVFVVLLLMSCAAITYYFHFILGVEVVYTHLFYVPIAIAAVWWGKWAFFVALFLAVIVSASHISSGVEHPLTNDLLRGAMFLVVASVLGIAVEQKNKTIEELTRRGGSPR